jgi:hypothetical protein
MKFYAALVSLMLVSFAAGAAVFIPLFNTLPAAAPYSVAQMFGYPLVVAAVIALVFASGVQIGKRLGIKL